MLQAVFTKQGSQGGAQIGVLVAPAPSANCVATAFSEEVRKHAVVHWEKRLGEHSQTYYNYATLNF